MHRLSAALFSIPASQVADAQFEQVKKFVVFGLAGAFALLSMIVSTIVHLQPKAPRGSGKLSRMARRWLARRRRPLIIHRDVPGPVQVREKMRVVYVPCDPATGKVLDPDSVEAKT